MVCECRIVKDIHLDDDSGFVPGIINVAINPSTSVGINTGTISITAHSFTSQTGAFLEKGPFTICKFLRIQGSINWLVKPKCAIATEGTFSTIFPGESPDGSRLFFYPQIQGPLVIEVDESIGAPHANVSLPSPMILELREEDLLNPNGSPTFGVDISGGPHNTIKTGKAYQYKYARFVGIDEFFTFDTLSTQSTLATPVNLEIDGTIFKAYPQSFDLNVQPPTPASITFTFIYEDIDRGINEIDACDS